MTSYWEDAEQVARFAQREPDRRLAELLEFFVQPSQTRVLDLGCAAGRNTVLLARAGFDFYAVDTSAAMVEKTRERVTAIVGVTSAADRVRVGAMEDLLGFDDEFFSLVVSLGVYHQARSPGQWLQALDETCRVLAPEGLLLTASFSPASQPHGEPLRPVPGQDHMFDGFRSGPLCLVDAAQFDNTMNRHGLLPETPTYAVRVPTDEGYRVTVNGLYRKRASQ